MNDGFWIQSGTPRNTGERDDEDENLCEAIETIFPLQSERMYMVFSGVHIPLSYKYDMSVMIDDVIKMVKDLSSKDSGSVSVAWPSNMFRATWVLSWDANMIEINADWETVVGDIQGLLMQRRLLRLSKEAFLSEWKKPLESIANALRDCGYSDCKLEGFQDLKFAVEKIRGQGILYR